MLTDFVLVWEEPVNQTKPVEPEVKSPDTTHHIHRKWRKEFLSRLQTAGLHQEMVSIIVPWSVLTSQAAEHE